MPAIPVHTPLGFLGFALIVLGVFLFLAGLGVLSVQKVSVQPGRLTLASGVVSALIGLALVLIFESGGKGGTTALTSPEQALARASSWPVVFYEPFDGNAAGWKLDSIDDVAKSSTQTIAGGSLTWKLASKNPDYWWWTTAPTDAFGDLSYALRVRRLSGPEGMHASYGLVFRKQGETAYRFLVNDAGQYAVQAYDHARDPKVRDLIGSTRTGLLDAGQFNELRVVAIGSHLTFFINGEHVASVDDAAFARGNVGFAVLPDPDALNRTIEYDFDDLEVRAPAPSD